MLANAVLYPARRDTLVDLVRCLSMPRRWCCRWKRYGVRFHVESSMNIEGVLYLPVKPATELLVGESVELYDYEVEALVLVHYEGLTTEEAAARMRLSKATFWRILEQARFKLAKAFVERKPIMVVSSKQSSQEPLR